MKFIDSFPKPLHDQKTQQPSSSIVGNSQNCLVSSTMSLVYVSFMSSMSFIGWIDILLAIMELLFHMYGIDFTTHGSNLKSPDLPISLNCNCDLVAHSSLPMDPFAHRDTIPLIFSAVYDIYSNISEPHELFYRVVKVLHQIGRKIHGFIRDTTTTHNAYFVESFDVIWERVCRDIFSIIDYALF